MARQLIQSSPRLETARSSNQLEDSSYKTIRVFTRKPHENDNRLINRTKRTRGSGEDFSSFYSPTHHQYDQVQKGRIDMKTILARTPLNNKGEDSTVKLGFDRTQDGIQSPLHTPQLRLPPRMKVKLSDQQHQSQQRLNTQTTDASQFTSRNSQQKAILQNKLEHLHTCVNSLSAQNKRLRQELSKFTQINTLSHSTTDLSERLIKLKDYEEKELSQLIYIENMKRQNDNLRLQNEMFTQRGGYRSQLTDSLEKQLKQTKDRLIESGQKNIQLQNTLKLLQQNVSILKENTQFQATELQRKEEVIKELAEMLRDSNLNLQVQKSKTNCLQKSNDIHQEELHKEKQRNKYLQIEIHMLRHKKTIHENSKFSDFERSKLIEANQKLRDETTRLKKSQRERNLELFELSPEKNQREVTTY